MNRAFAIVVALSGCDAVFGLKSVSTRFADARPVDVAGPIAPCVDDGTHDEDGDAFPDSCDDCPTVTSRQLDTDGDGVGDECDPSPGGDTIRAFYPFDTKSGLMTAGTVTVVGDSLKLATGATITTSVSFTALERVTVQFSGFATAPLSTSLVVTVATGKSGQIDCQVARICTDGADVCLDGFQNNIHVTTPAPLTITPAEVASVSVYREGGVARCGLDDVDQIHTAPLPAAMPSGAVQVSVPDGPLTLDNMIVYDTVP